MKHNYKLTLAFDGTAYQGWQRQKTTDQTIQTVLERALSACLEGSVRLTGSGRTDAGVHAEAMSAHFITEEGWPAAAEGIADPEGFLWELNRRLPEDIRVYRLEEMPLSFHARFHAKGKIYRYQIDTRQKCGVFRRKYVCHIPGPLLVEEMRRSAGMLVGTHDFSGFTMDKTKGKSKVRTIYRIDVEEADGLLILCFYGSGFLYHMVRILSGTLIEVGRGERKAESVLEILEHGERKAAGFLAPAQGLFLEQVLY